MEKYIYDESNGLWYELHGDYYLPCLLAPANDAPIGIWGQRHLRYIREHQKVRHLSLLLNGTLNRYLAEIDQRATEMLDSLTKQLAANDGITEHLKETNQMEWVRRMNAVRNAAMEVVNTEVIYA